MDVTAVASGDGNILEYQGFVGGSLANQRFSLLSGGRARGASRYRPDNSEVDWAAVQRGFVRGDREAIELVAGVINRIFALKGVPSGDVEDLLMDTLLALQNASKREIRNFKSYVYAAARNKYVDWVRAAQRAPCEELDPDHHVAPEAVDAILFARLRRCIERLDDRLRRVMKHKFLAGKSDAEIAEIMDVSLPTVRRHARAAKEQLRELLLS